MLRDLTGPNPVLEGCNRGQVKSIWCFSQLMTKKSSYASNVALFIHVHMSRVFDPPGASFSTTSFHLSTNCVRNEVERLRLGGSLLKEASGDVGGPQVHAPYWRPKENVGSTLSIRSGQRQGPSLSSVVCELPLRPIPGPCHPERRRTRYWGQF